MKAFFTILSILFFQCSVFAQKEGEKKTQIASVNLGIGLGYGQQIGICGFSTLQFSNKVYTGIHIIGTSYNAMKLPDDYNSPMGSPSDPPPTDRFTSFSAIIGKQLQKDGNNYSFFLEGGISLIRYNKLSFDKIRSPGFFGGYLSENNPVHVPGLMLGSGMNYIIGKKSTLGLSLHGNINSTRSVGFGSLSFALNVL